MFVADRTGKMEARTGDERPAVDALKKLLGSELRVTVRDGRVFIGQAHVFDNEGTVVLVRAREFRTMDESLVDPPVDGTYRTLSQVILPAKEAVRWEVASAGTHIRFEAGEPSV